jgi:hypothetical protein
MTTSLLVMLKAFTQTHNVVNGITNSRVESYNPGVAPTYLQIDFGASFIFKARLNNLHK